MRIERYRGGLLGLAAVDAVGTELMGIPKKGIGLTRMAQAYGMGTLESIQTRFKGGAFETMVKQFDPVPKKFRFPGSFGDVYGWEGL